MSTSLSITPKELAVFVELVAGFHPSEGEVRTLLAVAQMFAASQRAKVDGGQSVLDTPMTAEAIRSFRAALARATGVRGE